MAAGTPVSLRDARERTIALLSEHFANDRLDLEEYEDRVSAAHRAAAPAELEKLTSDLPAPEGALVPVPRAELVPAADTPDKQSVVAVLGGAMRQGSWTSARRLKVVAVMGGSVLDFREARLGPGVTDVNVFALMGGVQIIVPPELSVETGGVAIMGGFEHMERAPAQADPERPSLRVHGFCLMGGVSIETRLQGETEREARRRRRKERKHERRLARDQRRLSDGGRR